MRIAAAIVVLCWAALGRTNGQPTSPNRVLELDGNSSYVELPPNIFNTLSDATVEGWLRWNSFAGWSRFFDFGSQERQIAVANLERTRTLRFGFRSEEHTSELQSRGHL